MSFAKFRALYSRTALIRVLFTKKEGGGGKGGLVRTIFI